MRFAVIIALAGTLLSVSSSCAALPANERNAFLTLTETFGIGASDDELDRGAGGGFNAELPFRREMSVTFNNNHPGAELNVSFAAWINISSIRSADQQDTLLRGGYVQVTRELRIGNVYTLPPGTFVFNGPGFAGTTTVRLNAAGAAGPTTETFNIITPDVVLAFSQPPVSCDSVAFFYSLDGEPLTAVPVADPAAPFQGATGLGGFKTLAQVDVYQCEPLRPGLFLKPGGGAKQPNEYFEGENVVFDFFSLPDPDGSFANVTIGP